MGLEQASHEWIFRMDSDDICRKNRFELQVEEILKKPQLDVLGGYISEFETLPSVPSVPSGTRVVPLLHHKILSALPVYCPFNHVTVAFRKSKVLSIGSYKGGRGFPKTIIFGLG